MASPSARAIDDVVKLVVADAIRPAGFKGSGRTFHRPQGPLFAALCFQASQWNSPDRADFTLNVQVVLPLFHRVWTQREMPRNPATAVPVIDARIGHLMPDGCDLWWQVDSRSTVPSVLASEIASLIRDYALPFVDRIDSVEAVLRLLREHRKSRISVYRPEILEAVCLAELGRLGEAQALLEQLASTAKPKVLRETVRRISNALDAAAA